MLGTLWTCITNCFKLHPHVKSRFGCSCSNDSLSSEEKTPDRRTWLQKHRPDPPVETYTTVCVKHFVGLVKR